MSENERVRENDRTDFERRAWRSFYGLGCALAVLWGATLVVLFW